MTETLETQVAVLRNEVKHLGEKVDDNNISLLATLEGVQRSLDQLTSKVDEQDGLIQRGKGVLIVLGLFGSALMALPALLSNLLKIFKGTS